MCVIKDGFTAVHVAASQGRLDVMEYLLTKVRADAILLDQVHDYLETNLPTVGRFHGCQEGNIMLRSDTN